MGPLADLTRELNQDHAVPHLDGVTAHGLFAHEAGTGGEVESPAVVRAGEIAAEHVALDERIAFVGARVLDGVDLAVDAEDRDRMPVVLDEGASRRIELGQWDRESFHPT